MQDVSLYSSGSDDDFVVMTPASQSPESPIIIQAQQALKQVQILSGFCPPVHEAMLACKIFDYVSMASTSLLGRASLALLASR